MNLINLYFILTYVLGWKFFHFEILKIFILMTKKKVNWTVPLLWTFVFIHYLQMKNEKNIFNKKNVANIKDKWDIKDSLSFINRLSFNTNTNLFSCPRILKSSQDGEWLESSEWSPGEPFLDYLLFGKLWHTSVFTYLYILVPHTFNRTHCRVHIETYKRPQK